jgi:phosphate transport system substrate-binding protein
VGVVSYDISAQELSSDELIEIPDTVGQTLTSTKFDKIVPGVSGTITSVGSDTLANLMSLWSEAFKRRYPHVKFQLQASGSATAPQALTQGTATVGPMSREPTVDEISRFTRKFGYSPTTLKVAVDAIAIFVEHNNPLQALNLKQIDALFSVTRLCGESNRLDTWNQLEIGKFGSNRKIITFGRNSSSGTYDLFKQQALCGGDFKARVNELSGSASVVRSVASSIGGIGYAALGASIDSVRPISVVIPSRNDQSNGSVRQVAPSPENITNGDYPFSRFLYIMVNKDPNKPLPTLERTFLSFILSEQGQSMVSENGYYPILPSTKNSQRELLF